MGQRVSFLIVSSQGRQRRFSVSRWLVWSVVLVLLGLVCAGGLGVAAYQRHRVLEQQCRQLEADKARLEAFTRALTEVRREERQVRRLLGLHGSDNATESPNAVNRSGR